MHAGRSQTDHHVAGRDIGARQERAALGRADGEAGEVVVPTLVDARHLRGLAADQRAARLSASGGNAGHDLGADRRIEFPAGKIIEEEQRLGSLHHEIIDRHGDEIDADRVVAAGFDGDLHLGADAVGGGDQDRIGEAGGLEIEQAAEAADLGVRAGARGPAQQRLDQFHHAVAGVDIDAGGRVARLVHGATDRQILLPRRGGTSRRLLRGNCRVRKHAGAAIYWGARTRRAVASAPGNRGPD